MLVVRQKRHSNTVTSCDVCLCMCMYVFVYVYVYVCVCVYVCIIVRYVCVHRTTEEAFRHIEYLWCVCVCVCFEGELEHFECV